MSRRWTFDEDRFLHAYFDAVGDIVGEHDLGRPRGAATARVRKLKANGAWGALTDLQNARAHYFEIVGTSSIDEGPDFL